LSSRFLCVLFFRCFRPCNLLEDVMIVGASRHAAALALLSGLLFGTFSANAAQTQVQRGKYLVSILPCTDCHTPGTFLGHPDMKRYLGGSEVGFEVPGLGVFYGPNLTPDDETGLGKWTKEQIATAITTGKRPDGRILAPPMPVESFKNLTHSDALAIAAYLKTLRAIKNKVPGPFGLTEKPTSFVYQVLPPDKYVPTPPPK
jgi:mono/diheme cytochrome c family protein